MYEDEFELTFQVPEEESAPEPLAAPAAKPAAPVEPVVDEPTRIMTLEKTAAPVVDEPTRVITLEKTAEPPAVEPPEEPAPQPEEPAPQLRRLVVGERVGAGGGACALLRALDRCAVARGLHRVDDSLIGRRALHPHGVGQQADRARRHARYVRHRLFHARRAGRAAHAGDVILLQCRSSFAVRLIS